VVDALAEEAERGYDLTKAGRVRMGRPPLGEGGESPRIQVRVDRDLAKAFGARARKEHRSVSEIARTALREYVAAGLKAWTKRYICRTRPTLLRAESL
jgi:hypothetical protein